MPELAEVDYYRKCWNPGMGGKILGIQLHEQKRIFRGADIAAMKSALPGKLLVESESRGKQMVFRFSGNLWLGIHLGMTGALRVEKAGFPPEPHDHLVLQQKKQALVFRDARQFGRVRFHAGPGTPDWWAKLPPGLDAKTFTAKLMSEFMDRHRKLPIKATLLLQDGFPGIGNWMADEILWRAKLNPHTPTGQIDPDHRKELWRMVRYVCQGAIKHVSPDFADPPKGWLFHQRWSRKGKCPIHGELLQRETIGGRTTAWCVKCQR